MPLKFTFAPELIDDIFDVILNLEKGIVAESPRKFGKTLIEYINVLEPLFWGQLLFPVPLESLPANQIEKIHSNELLTTLLDGEIILFPEKEIIDFSLYKREADRLTHELQTYNEYEHFSNILSQINTDWVNENITLIKTINEYGMSNTILFKPYGNALINSLSINNVSVFEPSIHNFVWDFTDRILKSNVPNITIDTLLKDSVKEIQQKTGFVLLSSFESPIALSVLLRGLREHGRQTIDADLISSIRNIKEIKDYSEERLKFDNLYRKGSYSELFRSLKRINSVVSEFKENFIVNSTKERLINSLTQEDPSIGYVHFLGESMIDFNHHSMRILFGEHQTEMIMNCLTFFDYISNLSLRILTNKNHFMNVETYRRSLEDLEKIVNIEEFFAYYMDQILRFCLNWESHPALYQNLSEEDMRDIILDHLNTVVKDSSSGETFNKIGKVDIFINLVGDKNKIIGECKIWKGKIEYLGSISQLLTRYIDHLQSYAFLIHFIKLKKGSYESICKKAIKTIKNHNSFKNFRVCNTSDRKMVSIHRHPSDSKETVTLRHILVYLRQSP